MRFVWHENDLPAAEVPVVVKTNHIAYHVAVYSNGWLVRNGRRFSSEKDFFGGGERITQWAYIGGEV